MHEIKKLVSLGLATRAEHWPESVSRSLGPFVILIMGTQLTPLLFLGFFQLINISSCENITDPLAFLSKFGYIDTRLVPGNVSHDSPAPRMDITDAVKRFQNFVGLAETGDLDDDTVKWMQRPRCGVRDLDGAVHDSNSSAQPFQVLRNICSSI